MNSGRSEADPWSSVGFGIIGGHHATIPLLRSAPKTLLHAEVAAAYPDHPGTVFIITLPLTPDDASETEHMRSG